MSKRAPPKALYSSTLDDVALRYLKHTRPVNEVELKITQALACLEALEALVFAPTAVFQVDGENVPLAMLTNAVGVPAMERLLENGALGHDESLHAASSSDASSQLSESV